MNSYTRTTADCLITGVSDDDAKNLIRVLENSGCGLRGYYTGVLHIAGDYDLDLEQLTASGAAQCIGALLHKYGVVYMQFGYANYADGNRPGSADGGYFRITDNGEVIFPELRWPETKRKAKKRAA